MTEAGTRMIYTIGHSTHDLDTFLSLLKRYKVTAVVDVRSQPYSRTPHFNRESLAESLNAQGTQYLFLGRELGARREETQCYVGDQALYERVAELPRFRAGLNQLTKSAREHAVAVMCSEKEPLDCHRTVLISRHLQRLGFLVLHILADGRVEKHEQTEKRLVEMMGIKRSLFEPDLSDADLVDRAYEARGKEIAYRAPREGAPQ